MPKLIEEYLKDIEVKKEEKRQELLQKTIKALSSLSRKFPFQAAYIFGSILKRKRFYYDSDIDIAVAGLAGKDFFSFMAKAAEILGRDVDVVQIESHRLKDKIVEEGLFWKRRWS